MKGCSTGTGAKGRAGGGGKEEEEVKLEEARESVGGGGGGGVGGGDIKAVVEMGMQRSGASAAEGRWEGPTRSEGRGHGGPPARVNVKGPAL